MDGLLPSWLAGDDTTSEDDGTPLTSPRGGDGNPHRLRAIGDTVKHSAGERLTQLASSARGKAVVDGVLTQATALMANPKAIGELERVAALKTKSKDIWQNALKNDEEKIAKTKRGTVKALEITERLATHADPGGEVAETFADAARKLKGIVETGKTRDEVLEMSKNLGKDLWTKLSTKAKGSDHFEGMRGTVERIVDRVKALMTKLQEEKLKRDEEEAISAVLNAGDTTKDAIDSRLKTLADESKDVWSDLRADDQVRRLIKEEVVPGFERLIRGAVQVSCELMAKLELPRVDGVYDSPLGSVCYHVDNVHFSEFEVQKESLRVINHMDEDDEGAGLSTTVEVGDIKTTMKDVEFAYCEFPRNWGMVDGEGLCTVTVDGASVGITYEIIINTQQLLKLVNQGVELAKDDSKIKELNEKIQEKIKLRKEQKEREAAAKAKAAAEKPVPATPPMPIESRKSIDSVDSFDSGRDQFGSPVSDLDVDSLGSALDRAFGSNRFNDAEDDVDSPPMSPTSPGGSQFHDATDDARVLDAKEKLARNRKVVGEILGDGFLGDDPVLELRVHTTHISVGELDVNISGTSAAWLYNMIALVLTQQLRGTIEEKINNITVKQLARVSGAVAAYSAGLIEVSIYQDEDEEDELGSMFSGVTGSLRQNPGKWGEDWRCSHCPGEAPEHVEHRRKFGSRSQSKTSFENLDELIREADAEEEARQRDTESEAPAEAPIDAGVDWNEIASPM